MKVINTVQIIGNCGAGSEIDYKKAYQEQKKANKKLITENGRLQEKADRYDCLEGAGVDNWDGYDEAMEGRYGR